MEIIISAGVSLLVQFVKRYLKTSKLGTLAFLFVVSFAVAGGMFYLQNTELWETFLKIALYAGGVYAIFIKRFEQEDVVKTN